MAVTIELSFEQLHTAVRQLPRQQKTELWNMLSEEIDLAEIHRRTQQAVTEIREAYNISAKMKSWLM